MVKRVPARAQLVKRQVRASADLVERTRHACAALAADLTTLGTLVGGAIERRVDALERRHHNGRAWPAADVMPRRIGCDRRETPEGGWSVLPFRISKALDQRSKAAARGMGVLWVDLVIDALTRELARLERQHNGGKPFPPAAVPLGRREGDRYAGQVARP